MLAIAHMVEIHVEMKSFRKIMDNPQMIVHKQELHTYYITTLIRILIPNKQDTHTNHELNILKLDVVISVAGSMCYI